MKVLVLGGTGMAGHTIALYFSESGHDVTILARNKTAFPNQIIGDVTDFNKLKKYIRTEKYDAVINAVGILNQHAEDNKSHAVLVNSYLPHFLTEITKDLNTKVIQMSTDCVFSGEEGSYKEDSFKNGLTFYDRTKALGELENNKDLTFRNSIIGPDLKTEGIGLFNWFMQQTNSVNGFTKAIWSGVTTLTLAQAMEEALKQNLSGLYNLSNNKPISKYQLLQLFNKHIKETKLEIIPTDKVVVDKSLINTRKDFDFIVPDYESMVIDMGEWINSHRELYPHYYN